MAGFKAGYVAILGRPNVGKSTLVNALLGQKVAAVSPRPQTTRRNQLGILNSPDSQIVFIDTPGLHEKRNKLGELMNQEALFALEDADVLLFLVDAADAPGNEDSNLAEALAKRKRKQPVLLILNKIDLIDTQMRRGRRTQYDAVAQAGQTLEISALNGQGLPELLTQILSLLPEGLAFFPPDQVTDLWERQIAADLIREAALQRLRDEVPHGIAVRVENFTERGEKGALIEATLYVERDSHKGIVVGEGGKMIKLIGQAARKEIEAMSGRKVFLDLRVKVKENWRDDENQLEKFGYARNAD